MEGRIPFNLNKPIVFFDLETTGLDFKYDRIIEIGALRINPDGKKETYHQRVNPGIRIPAEVTALTGISNEHVAGAPPFSQVVEEVDGFFRDADLGGYGICRFDIKVLSEEFKRLNRNFNLDGRSVVDMQVIFHQKEKRDLSAAFKFYCDKELIDAHSAQADTTATYEIFLSQLERYQDLPKDMAGLHNICRGDQDRFVDSEGKFFWRDGEAVFNFGKYKSMTLRAVAKDHREYLNWVMSPERNFGQDVVDICYQALSGRFPKKAEKC